MAEEKDRPRPHGDPLGETAEENRAQQQSDAPADTGGSPGGVTEVSDRAGGRGSTAGGIPTFDEDAGEKRRKQYKTGADLVSGID